MVLPELTLKRMRFTFLHLRPAQSASFASEGKERSRDGRLEGIADHSPVPLNILEHVVREDIPLLDLALA